MYQSQPEVKHHFFQDEQLGKYIHTFLGDLGQQAMALLLARLKWVKVAAGTTLMEQGDPGDALFMVVSGMLRIYIRDEDGVERRVRETGRGQIIGEMSLYTQEPRSATVVALRDTVLVRLGKDDFDDLLGRSAQASIAMTRQIIARLNSKQAGINSTRPVTMCLLPITPQIDLGHFSQRLAEQLRKIGSVCIVYQHNSSFALPQDPPDQGQQVDTQSLRIARHLDAMEAAHDFVLLVGDDQPTAWTQRCVQHSDEILLVADATQKPDLHPTESEILMQRKGRTEIEEILVLLHPEQTRCPSHTKRWLARRPVAHHIHIRPALDADMARLARIQSRTAVGLVFSGGGARGFAHLGVYRALKEKGIEIDCVGGTSMGAVMATLVASDQPVKQVMQIARDAFRINPTGDYNVFPLLSLIKGKRLRNIVNASTEKLLGAQADVEDLWKNYYCIASNYSQAREQVIQHGNLVQALLASMAIPGALPPVLINGELLCDGGTFNNFPADVMRSQRGIHQVIGVDLGVGKLRRIDNDEVPSAWALLLDRLRPRKRRRYRFPSLLAFMMNVNILYSSSRQPVSKKMTDLYFNPPLVRVGMLEWKKFDRIVEQGYAHAIQVLAGVEKARLE